MGLPTVAMSLLGLWMTPLEAAALLVLPSMATNVAQCRGAYLRRLAAALWPAWLALAVVTVLLPVPASAAAASNAHRLLGAVLVLYGLWGLWRPRLPVLSPRSRWAGLVAGGVTAATAVFVVPLVPYLQALRLQASGEQALLTAHAVLALAAAAAGLRLGEHIRARISAAVFQRALFVVFVFLGGANVAQGM
jgi:hypothetical protein